MKILHILDHSIPFHSGYSFRTRAILKGQKGLGWETYHVTGAKHGEALGPQYEFTPQEEVEGLSFYRTPSARGITMSVSATRQLTVVRGLSRRIAEIVQSTQPDILHAHSPLLNGLAALHVSHRTAIPVVYEVRAFWEDAAVDLGRGKEGGIRYKAARALETYVLKHADAVTCICNGLRNEILARGITPERVTVIPNGVNISDFSVGRDSDNDLLGGLGLRGSTILGFVGSFYSYEGLSLLLRSLPLMLEKRADIRVLLIGGGREEESLKNQAENLGIADKVVFTGRVPHDLVHRYYGLIDILVYPRERIRLTELVTPLKPLEAMAQGRLVLASDVGGHQELICHGRTGWLFRAGDPADLRDQALSLLQNQAIWPEIKRAARQFVEEQRDWDHIVKGYEAVYNQARRPSQS